MTSHAKHLEGLDHTSLHDWLLRGKYIYRRMMSALFLRRISQCDKRRNVTLEEPLDQYLNLLRDDGIAIIPGYFESGQLDELKASLDAISAMGSGIPAGGYTTGKSTIKTNGDDFRVWNVHLESPAVHRLFTENRDFNRIADAFFGGAAHRESTIYQSSRQSRSDRWQRSFGAQGFHFDNAYRTLKIFVYLDDVHEENGPFTYLKKSMDNGAYGKRDKLRDYYLEVYGLHRGDTPAAYYTEAEERAYQLRRHAVRVLGKAGTVIMADTLGLHVAGEIAPGNCRRVLVNSYRSSIVPRFPPCSVPRHDFWIAVG